MGITSHRSSKSTFGGTNILFIFFLLKFKQANPEQNRRIVNKNTSKVCIKKANDSQYELVEKLTYSMEGAVTRRESNHQGVSSSCQNTKVQNCEKNRIQKTLINNLYRHCFFPAEKQGIGDLPKYKLVIVKSIKHEKHTK